MVHDPEHHYETGPPQDESHNGGQGRTQYGEQPQTAETGSLRAEAPGFSINVKGSMLVILVAMLLGDAALNLWVLTQLDVHLTRQDILAANAHDDSVAMRAAISTEHNGITTEVRMNRIYMREIQRLCMMTPGQREKLQTTLSPALRELLFEGEKTKP